MRRAVLVVIAGWLSIGVIGAHGAPTTLVRTPGPIWAFAQDDGRIAWSSGRCGQVTIRSLANGRSRVVGSATIRTVFGERCLGAPDIELALAGSRALWSFIVEPRCGTPHGQVQLRSGGLRVRQRNVELLFVSQCRNLVTDGDRQVLGYGFTQAFSSGDGVDCEEGGLCLFRNFGIRVRRLLDGRVGRLPGAPAVVDLAVAGGRVAVIPAGGRLTIHPFPVADPGAAVTIRAATSGAGLASFAPVGRAKAVALAAGVATVLVEDGFGNKRLERYAATTGALLGSTPVPSSVQDELDAGPRWVLFQRGRELYVLDAQTGLTTLVWTAARTPIDASIEGSRIAWIENTAGGGVVRAITLPG
jgi:hypothetical protein